MKCLAQVELVGRSLISLNNKYTFHISFTGIEEDPIHKDTTANEKLERSREYTYQWLHTQVEVHETTSSRNMKW